MLGRSLLTPSSHIDFLMADAQLLLSENVKGSHIIPNALFGIHFF